MKKVKVDFNSLHVIACDIIDLVVKKNQDYGDAWQSFGIFTPLVRINDKMLRVKNLSDGKQALIADESIKDNLRDIVAYGLLALLRLEWEEMHPVTKQMPLPGTHEEAVIQNIIKTDNENINDFKTSILNSCEQLNKLMNINCNHFFLHCTQSVCDVLQRNYGDRPEIGNYIFDIIIDDELALRGDNSDIFIRFVDNFGNEAI